MIPISISESRGHEESLLSASLRSLARDVRKMVEQGPRSPAEIASATRRIHKLRETLRSSAPDRTPLERWLDNLQNEVDALRFERAAC